MSEAVANVLESPAIAVLVQLEADGFEVAAVGDRLRVKPISRLTAARRAELERYRAEILMLLRICDAAVQVRREAFTAQLAEAGASIPAFVFHPHARVIYAPGACYSCAEPSPKAFSRCWRCALALRLVCRAPIPSTFMAPYDAARAA